MMFGRASGSWCCVWPNRRAWDTHCHRSCPARSLAHGRGTRIHRIWPPHWVGTAPVNPPSVFAAIADPHRLA